MSPALRLFGDCAWASPSPGGGLVTAQTRTPRCAPTDGAGAYALTAHGAQSGTVAWAGVIGIVDLPSAVAPIGRTPAGLPVGMQIVAPYLRDRDAIQLCAIVARVSGGGYEPPPNF